MVKNRDLEIGMAEMRTDIKYIKKALDENRKEHKDVLDTMKDFVNKVDEELDKRAYKKDVEDLNNKLIKFLVYIIITLIGIVGFFIKLKLMR